MDADRFDTLARTLTVANSRRNALVATLSSALGIVLGTSSIERAEARKPCPPCKKRKKGKCKKKLPDGTACSGGGVCRGGSCCVPEPAAVTCADAPCQTARNNNCGQAVACHCPAGQDCLANGSCAIPCNDTTAPCPAACNTCSNPNMEGKRYCIHNFSCVDTEVCSAPTGTAGCDRGFQCQSVPCFGGGTPGPNCLPLCTS